MNRVEFDFYIPSDHACLPGHFPQHPIVPGVLLLDHVLSNLQRATGHRVSCLRQVKFTAALRPRELAHAMCEVDGESATFRVNVQREGLVVTAASGSLAMRPDNEPSS